MGAGNKRKSTESDGSSSKKAFFKIPHEKPQVSDGDEPWTKVGASKSVLIFTSPNIAHNSQIASFDLDGTLITTKSGKKFPKDRSDWQFWHPDVPKKLKELAAEGYKVVLFSNQAGLDDGKAKEADITGKVLDIMKKVDIPFQAFISGKKDDFRKPSPEMWKLMVKLFHEGMEIDLVKSFYVGDAAGRPKDWAPGKPKDFSASDRHFALNVGLPFHTPEEFFRKQKIAKFELGFDPRSLLASAAKPSSVDLLGKQELILMVGFPASGKSTWSEKKLVSRGFVRVNQDVLKTKEKCLKACKDALDSGKSVVIDNTNPTKAARAEYIKLAKTKGIPVRCCHMQVSLDLACHLNRFRERVSNGKHAHVPSIALFNFRKNLEEPSLDEGFSEVVKVEFTPEFDRPEHRDQFCLFYETK